VKVDRRTASALILLGSCTLVLGGCTRATPAPANLSSLSQVLFGTFEHPSDRLLGQLLVDLEQVGVGEGLEDEAFAIEALDDSLVSDLSGPDRDLGLAPGVGAFTESGFSVPDHTAYMTLADLLPVAGSAETYDRTFVQDSDPDCFIAGDCQYLRTSNHIVREGFGFSFEYTYFKDYRWVMPSTSDEPMIVGRGWSEESVHGEAGQNHIWQWYDLDVWMHQEEGTLRYISIWSEAEYAGLTDALTESMLISAIHDSFAIYESYLEGQGG